jgi:cyclopropane fatty-acyl-phospholipid synthase-like methyltransferase
MNTEQDQDQYLSEFFNKENYNLGLGSIAEHEVIASEISDDDAVLDVGCGHNLFKSMIKNVTGIDKYNTAADVLVDTLDFDAADEFYDVVIALGSTNFPPFETIEAQIDRLVRWCKPGGRIYMRVNPCISEVNTPKTAYPWTLVDVFNFAKKYNLEFIKPVTVTKNTRLIWTWQKPKNPQ